MSPWTATHQASLSFNIFQSLLKLMSIESVMPSNHIIFCCSVLLLPSIIPSIRVFSIELALCIWGTNYWSFSFSVSPSNEYSELISFQIDWFDLFAVQGTLRSLLQHFFMVQLSQPYVATGKTIPLTMLLMLSRFSRVQLCATPWTAARQAPLSMGFSRQEYWSGVLCPPPGDLPDPGL